MINYQKVKPYPFKRVTDPEVIKKIHNLPHFVEKRARALEFLKRVGIPDFEKFKSK